MLLHHLPRATQPSSPILRCSTSRRRRRRNSPVPRTEGVWLLVSRPCAAASSARRPANAASIASNASSRREQRNRKNNAHASSPMMDGWDRSVA
ncbi:hypothetical protein VTN02DRAFT_3657 [Thermoascus thermophilus]